MPSLHEISEAGAAAHERCVRESIAMDYAYLADTRAIEGGTRPTRLNQLIERQYQQALRNLNVDGDLGSGTGIDPGSNPGA